MPRRRRRSPATRPSVKVRPVKGPTHRVSKATRQKLSAQRRAYLRTGKTKAERAEARRAPRISKQTREKLSAARRAFVRTGKTQAERAAERAAAARSRRVSRATREKLSAQRRAFVRTGKTKAERAFETARRTLERQRATAATLRAQAERRTSAASRSREYWRAVRSIAAQEGVSALEARHRHKERVESARIAARTRPVDRPVWQAREGTEEQAFGLAGLVPELPGLLPPNTLALAHIRLENWPGGIGNGTVHTELVSVPFMTGGTYDEFWRNYHDALRPFTDAFTMAQGIGAGERKTKSPTTTSYWIASIQAA